jgi:hypothetical protein
MSGTIDAYKFYKDIIDRHQSFAKSFSDIDGPLIEAAL